MLEAQHKPLLQLSLQQTAAASFGPVPFAGPDVSAAWTPFFDLYVKLQRNVDSHIGPVLRTWRSRPEVAANTIVVFTSDHGEYGASHGLRGKGGGAYEEAIRVPLIVKDPRGALTAATRRPAHAAHLERGRGAAAADASPAARTRGGGTRATRTSPAARTSRAILANPRGAGAPLRAARHRRDRHRVRDRTVRGRRPAARGGAAHGRPRSTPPTPTGA